MKTKILISLLCLSLAANAQFSEGVKLNLGAGTISSANLASNLDYQRNVSPKITEWGVTNRWGFEYGFGGFIAYNFSENFSLLAEPAINFFKCGIDFKRVENKLDANGDGDIVSQSTTSDISIIYFNLPILAKYAFTKNKFFLLGGIGINFTGTPTIKSTGTSQKENYKNNVLEKTIIDPSYTLETKLNVFNSPRFNFIFGFGKAFDINGKDLTIDIRYSLPLTKSQMFTTDGNYNDGVFKRNDLLGVGGLTDAESKAPFLLNDFKMSVVTLSVSYALFKQ